MTGRTLKCDFCNAKSQFYRAFNAVYGKVGRAASEECVLDLLQAKCFIPILLYGTEACPLVSRDRQSFEFTVNRLFMEIFRTGCLSVVKECQQNFNFLSIESHLEIRKQPNFCKLSLQQRIHYVYCLNIVQSPNSIAYLTSITQMLFIALANWYAYCVMT